MLEGKGLKEILQELNRVGIAGPRGKPWTKTTENAFEAIVDREAFEKVRGILKKRAPAFSHPRRTSSPYLLSGIARCGLCGRAMVAQEARSGKFAYYVCGTLLKRGAGSCGAPYLNAAKFEALVINKIKGTSSPRRTSGSW